MGKEQADRLHYIHTATSTNVLNIFAYSCSFYFGGDAGKTQQVQLFIG
jgi:hypothetical protein